MTVNNLNSVPLAIRPMKLGAPKGPREGYILRKMMSEKPKKKPKNKSKSTMIISPGGTVYKTQQQVAVANFLKRIAMESPSPKKK
jgi:hypothetical protein